ncbi:HAD-IA family hydrolase [Microvirga sp. W0021]|uniref:Phosphoglycolate phosphatase n=1 Tax=Hohaiivirga grylli TaxID=3133970 RepID=A0ABV0BIE1_9HYPH
MSANFQPIAVFDLDGTLADTAPDLISTLNVILAKENLPALPLEGAKELIGAGARALIERGFQRSGTSISEDRLEVLFQEFVAEYNNRLCVDSKLFPGVPEALDKLSSEGILLAVCTNKFEDQSLKLLELLGILDRFTFISGRDTFPFFKPDPRHLTETIAKAGADPRLAVMVGDSNTDITTAKRAEIPVIGVPFGYTDTPVDQLNPDLVVTHYNDLPAAVEKLLIASLKRNFPKGISAEDKASGGKWWARQGLNL